MAACTTWQDPRATQNNRSFVYDVDHYGQLGIKVGYQSAYIIGANGCYDLSFKSFSRLEFLFNNKIDDSLIADPSYLGVLAIRTFPIDWGNTEPVLAAFYRNAGELDTTSQWAALAQATDPVSPRDVIESNRLLFLGDPYEPEVDIEVPSVAAASALVSGYASIADEAQRRLVAEWHALVVEQSAVADKTRVLRDTATSGSRWAVDTALIPTRSTGVMVQRHYLIKFRDSAAPSRKVFFSVGGIASADCLYIKLIDPRTPVPLLGVSPEAGELLVFKLKTAAAC